MGLLLNILASISKWLLQPFAYIYGCIFSIIKGEFQEYNLNLAISKDKYGNVLCKYLFNNLLIKDFSYSFGDHKYTISYVLGLNKELNRLTKIGKFIVWFIEKLDPGHFKRAVDGKI